MVWAVVVLMGRTRLPSHIRALVEAQTTGRQEQAKNAPQDGPRAPKQSERDWQATVLKYAALRGWKRYRTIVADPPWPYDEGWPGWALSREERRALPYPSMTLDEIKALPVGRLAEPEGQFLPWGIPHDAGVAGRTVFAWA